MGGEVKLLRFSEGVSTTSPTPSTTQIGNLVTYSSTTAFLTAKGAVASPGDIFFNSSETSVNLYDSNNNWRNVYPSKTRKISAEYTATIDDTDIECTSGTFKINLYQMSLGPDRDLNITNSGTGVVTLSPYLSETFADNIQKRYLSSTQWVRIGNNSTYWFVKSFKKLIGLAKDIKTKSTDGGTTTNNSTMTRDLNTTEGEYTKFGTLSSNRMLLNPGYYFFKSRAPAFLSERSQLHLLNCNNSSITIEGNSAQCGSAADGIVQVYAELEGFLSIDSSTSYLLRQYFNIARATDGAGLDTNGTDNKTTNATYSTVQIEKLV